MDLLDMVQGDITDEMQARVEDKALARRTDPPTSHIAAAEMEEARLSLLQRVVLGALIARGGAGNNDDVVAETGLEWNTITPRMRPLCKRGYIQEVGKRRSKRTNKLQILWRITPRGRMVVESNVSR